MRIALIIVVAIVLIVGLYFIYTKMIKPKVIGSKPVSYSGTFAAPSVGTVSPSLIVEAPSFIAGPALGYKSQGLIQI